MAVPLMMVMTLCRMMACMKVRTMIVLDRCIFSVRMRQRHPLRHEDAGQQDQG